MKADQEENKQSIYELRKQKAFNRFLKRNPHVSAELLREAGKYNPRTQNYELIGEEYEKRTTPPPILTREAIRLPIAAEDGKDLTVIEILKTCRFDPILELVNIYNATQDLKLRYNIAKEIIPYIHPRTATAEAQSTSPVSFNILIGSETLANSIKIDKRDKCVAPTPVIDIT